MTSLYRYSKVFYLVSVLTSTIVLLKRFAFKKKNNTVIDEANDYFPVQAPSERAAGHPIVGSV